MDKNDEPREKRSSSNGLEALALFSQLGITMAVPIVLGVLAGHWLDERLGTKILFLILLACMGIGAGMMGAYHQIMSVTKRKRP